MMIKGIDWDHGNWPKCGKHGLSKSDIEFVLRNNPLIKADRYPQDIETRYDAVGKTPKERHAFIVFTMRRKFGKILIRPISARYMHEKERKNYEQQQKA